MKRPDEVSRGACCAGQEGQLREVAIRRGMVSSISRTFAARVQGGGGAVGRAAVRLRRIARVTRGRFRSQTATAGVNPEADAVARWPTLNEERGERGAPEDLGPRRPLRPGGGRRRDVDSIADLASINHGSGASACASEASEGSGVVVYNTPQAL